MRGSQQYVLVANNDSGRNSENEGLLALGPAGSDNGKFGRSGIGRPIFRKGRGLDGARGRGVWTSIDTSRRFGGWRMGSTRTRNSTVARAGLLDV